MGVEEDVLFLGIVYWSVPYLSAPPLHRCVTALVSPYGTALYFGMAALAGTFSDLLAFGISFMLGTAGLSG